MANSLDIELKGKTVILDGRKFHCESGFGCSPVTSGQAIFGKFEGETETRKVSGYDVEKLAE